MPGQEVTRKKAKVASQCQELKCVSSQTGSGNENGLASSKPRSHGRTNCLSPPRGPRPSKGGCVEGNTTRQDPGRGWEAILKEDVSGLREASM